MRLSVGNLRRFWQKVRLGDNGCWDWGGSYYQDKRGDGHRHPKFSVGDKQFLARRVSYAIHFGGRVPKYLKPSCGNSRCVSPAHMEPAPNSSQSTSKVITATRPAAGWRKTDPKLVRKILSLRRRKHSRAEICRLLGLATGTVSLVVRMAELCREGQLGRATVGDKVA